MRNSVFQSNPPTLNPVPIGIIAGDVTVPASEFAHHSNLGQAFYTANGDNFHLFVGLKYYATDMTEANYYWLFCWFDEDTKKPGFWTLESTPEDRLKYVKEKLKDCHPDMVRILNDQRVDKMLEPFLLRDLIPTHCPDGPWALLGDATHAMSPCKPFAFFFHSLLYGLLIL